MGVHLPFGVNGAIGRLLMEAHGIGKRHVEHAVVAAGEVGERGCERGLLLGRQFVEAADTAAGESSSRTATRHLPNEMEKEGRRQAQYLLDHGRPAQHAADARFALGDDEPLVDPLGRRVGRKRREVVVEHEGVRVVGIARANWWRASTGAR